MSARTKRARDDGDSSEDPPVKQAPSTAASRSSRQQSEGSTSTRGNGTGAGVGAGAGAGGVQHTYADYSDEEELPGAGSVAAGAALTIATVCACNMNRSMAAHKLLQESGFKSVRSFGAAPRIKLPTGDPANPAVTFDWGSTYAQMKRVLTERFAPQKQWLKDHFIFDMLERNQSIKTGPKKWQEETDVAKFDIVVCFDDKVFDIVVEDIQTREPGSFEPVHVVNFSTKDNHDAAAVGAKICLDFIKKCAAVDIEELPSEMPGILADIGSECDSEPLYFLHYL